MLPIFTVGTSVVSFTFEMVVNDLPKVICLYKSDSELSNLLTTKGPTCKLVERLMLLTQRSGEVNNVLLLLFLPPTMDDPPRFLGKDVLITFGISLPAMIGV